MKLGKYSFGTGDRFAREGKAQLAAFVEAKNRGVDITPVWNKSHREHTITKSAPAIVRSEADEAVHAIGWNASYFVDADHITSDNIDLFLDSCDFFTIDVADFIGQPVDKRKLETFINRCGKYAGKLSIPGMDKMMHISQKQIADIARMYLPAVKEAGRIYRHIASAKGEGNFVTEISMDESETPQTPVELFIILAAVADENTPLAMIAPKFSGRFNKGIDYAGDVAQFEKEFNEDLAVIDFAIAQFDLPKNLKLSIHSGSDKFSLYGPINKALKRFDAGLHVKTAGTTWLAEIEACASAGGEGLETAKDIYEQAFARREELCKPYATVLDIDKRKLPTPDVVRRWSEEDFAGAVRHDRSSKLYNPNVRQLMHVAYKVAAEMGTRFTSLLKKYESVISICVTENLYKRHIVPLFIE